MDPIAGTVVIPIAVDGCARSFLSLEASLRQPTRFAEQVAVEAISDEFGRFKLWAGNIAAHRKGHRSLEYRLRDAAPLKAETNALLASLASALKTSLAIVEGTRIPWDEEIYSDSESDSADGNNQNLQGNTELRQLYARIRSIITSLMRLSMAIREPALNRQARCIDKSHFEQHDLLHVQEKFPSAPQYLAERLGRAISSRRQYLTYREMHHDKLAKGIDRLGLETVTTEFTLNSTEATRLQETGSSNIMDDRDDTASMTSYATSVNATLRVPNLPKEAQEKEQYNCPLCYGLVAIYTTAVWRRHVYQDLHPYCCTFRDCTTADRLFDSRHAWFAHELEAHRSSFQCVEGCSKTFREEADFEAHVKSKHADLAAPTVYAALKRTSVRSSSMTDVSNCCLCDKHMTLRSLQKHLGHHQEQLALFALPSNVDETEDDAEHDSRLGGISADEENYAVTNASNALQTERLIDDSYRSLYLDENALGELAAEASINAQIGRNLANPEHTAEWTAAVDPEVSILRTGSGDSPPVSAIEAPIVRPTETDSRGRLEQGAVILEDENVKHGELNEVVVRYLEAQNLSSRNQPRDTVQYDFEKWSELIQVSLEETLKELNLEHPKQQGSVTQDDRSALNLGAQETFMAKSQAHAVDQLETTPEQSDEEESQLMSERRPRKTAEGSQQSPSELASRRRFAITRELAVAQAEEGSEQSVVAGIDKSNLTTHDLQNTEEPMREQERSLSEGKQKIRRWIQEAQHQLYKVRGDTQQPHMTEPAHRAKEDEDTGAAVREHLVKSGFNEHQIHDMLHPSALTEPGKPRAALQIAAQPTYAKIKREHLDIETLHHYDLPYEIDADPEYIIVLREVSQKEVDVLFEHTRRLRSGRGVEASLPSGDDDDGWRRKAKK